MKNNLIFTSNEIDSNFNLKSVDNLETGDILKRKSDELYYSYNGVYSTEGAKTTDSNMIFANFFGYSVPKLKLKKFFYTEKNDIKVYVEKEK